MNGLRRRMGSLLRRRADVVGINRRNIDLVFTHNPRRLYPLADDKLLAKERLMAHGVPVPETLAVCDGAFAVADTVERLRDLEHFVLKPAQASGGSGILVVGERLAPDRWRRAGDGELGLDDLRQHLADIVFGRFDDDVGDRAFAERRVRPHPVYAALWDAGLCDVRILVLDGVPFLAMVRVPTRRSEGRANLHQGGIGLAIDLATGRTVGAYSAGTSLERHPESGAPLLGVQLPSWDETMDVGRRAAKAIPLGYLGVDVVVDRERGPLVLEVNARPGLEIQNVHGRGIGGLLAEATS
jgi:alpha-L-glutamate ligase-like protein